MEEYGRDKRPDSFETARNYFGFLLVIFGLIVACYVAVNAYMLYTDPHRLAPFHELVTEGIEASGSIQGTPAELVIHPSFLSYIIPILLLIIGTSVASMLISGGVKLLDGNVKKLQSFLKQKFGDFKD
jgi:hypothetical protein